MPNAVQIRRCIFCYFCRNFPPPSQTTLLKIIDLLIFGRFWWYLKFAIIKDLTDLFHHFCFTWRQCKFSRSSWKSFHHLFVVPKMCQSTTSQTTLYIFNFRTSNPPCDHVNKSQAAIPEFGAERNFDTFYIAWLGGHHADRRDPTTPETTVGWFLLNRGPS